MDLATVFCPTIPYANCRINFDYYLNVPCQFHNALSGAQTSLSPPPLICLLHAHSGQFSVSRLRNQEIWMCLDFLSRLKMKQKRLIQTVKR